MADFGIQTFRPNGSVAIDSTNKAGVFIESLTFAPGETGSKVYPDIPAGYMYHLVVKTKSNQYGPEAHAVTVGDDGTGQAKLSWTGYVNNGTVSTTVLVFARRTNAVSGSFGATILNADGDYLADLKYPVPQFNGVSKTIDPTQRIGNPWVHGGSGTSNGYLYKCRYPGSNYDVKDKLFFLYLPDSSDTDLWYALSPYDGAYQIPTLYIYSPNGANPGGAPYLPWPSMHQFTLGSTMSAGSSFGLQYFDAGGALTYDSSAENIAIKETSAITTMALQENYWDSSATVQIPISFSGQWGVLAPFFRAQYASDYDNFDSSTVEYWLSLYQRRGNTLYYKVLLVQGIKGTSQYNATVGEGDGTPRGGGVIIADISQLSPAPSITYTGY